MNHLKATYVFLAITLLLSLALAGCGSPASAAPAPTPTVEAKSGQASVAGVKVSATGQVIPAQWSSMSMSTAGLIKEILVKEGDGVSTGQVLMRLNGSEKYDAAITAARLAVLTSQQTLNDLYDNLDAARAAAQARLAKANKALDDANTRQKSQAYRHGNQNQIDTAWANLIVAQQHVDDAETAFTFYSDRPADDPDRAEMLARLSAVRQLRDRAQENFNYVSKLPDKFEVDTIDAGMAVAQAEVTLAQEEVSKWKDGPDPEKLSLAQANLANAQKQLEAGKSALADLELDAPFSGTISKVNVRTSEWVVPGQPVMLLADLSKLHIETTDLSEIDVAQIKLGNPVMITFDALPDVTAQGVVTKIAPKSSEGSGVNYTVTIDFNEIPDGLRWGMTAFVDIEVGNRAN